MFKRARLVSAGVARACAVRNPFFLKFCGFDVHAACESSVPRPPDTEPAWAPTKAQAHANLGL